MSSPQEDRAGTTADGRMTVGVVQAEAVIGDIARNLATLRALVQRVAEEGADAVVTPELFATGYDPATAWEHDGESIRHALAGLAADAGVGLAASTIDTASGASAEGTGFRPRHRIAASFFTPDGEELARVHKRHLYGPGEQEFLTPGDAYGMPFTWRGMTLGMGICYDVEFPEFPRTQARAGAHALLIPTAVPALEHSEPGRSAAWRYSATMTSTLQVPARALENGLLIAYANHCGTGFTGHSCVATPYGRNAVVLPEGEGTAVVEFGVADLGRARELNTYLRDLPADG